MAYTPTLFYKADLPPELATTWSRHWELIWDGYTPGSPVEDSRDTVTAHLSDLDALRVTDLADFNGDETTPNDGDTLIWDEGLDAWKSEAFTLEVTGMVPLEDVGAPSGVAPLDGDSLIPEINIPDRLSEVNLSGMIDQHVRDGSGIDIIEFGRLEDSVLTNRFGTEILRVGASSFIASSTSVPSQSTASQLTPYWGLDKDTDESVSCGGVVIPKPWAAFDVYVHGANSTGTSGDVVQLTAYWAQKGDDDDVSTSTKSATANLAVGATNIRKSIKVLSVLSSDNIDFTKSHVFRIKRVATSGSDTLVGDFRFLGITLVATAYVEFTPEAPPVVEDMSGRTFTQAHNALLGDLRVFQQNRPPDDDLDAVEYKYFPQTHAVTSQDFTTSTYSLGQKGIFFWANRRNYDTAWNKKPNVLPAPSVYVDGKLCRSVFTTLARADAATRAQIRHQTGFYDSTEIQEDWIAAGGSSGDFIDEADFRADPETYCDTDFVNGVTTYRVMVDKVLLPTPRLTDGFNTGLNDVILLDYEVGDTRTPAWTQNFLQNIADDIHAAGKLLYVYTNPLTATTMNYHGIDSSNLPAILDMSDFLSIFLWSKSIEGSIAASYAAQISRLGTIAADEWEKLVITFELGGVTTPGTTLSDATWVYNKLNEVGSTHPTAVNFWRNYALQGGAPTRLTNQKISTICFGTATPP